MRVLFGSYRWCHSTHLYRYVRGTTLLFLWSQWSVCYRWLLQLLYSLGRNLQIMCCFLRILQIMFFLVVYLGFVFILFNGYLLALLFLSLNMDTFHHLIPILFFPIPQLDRHSLIILSTLLLLLLLLIGYFPLCKLKLILRIEVNTCIFYLLL